MPLKPSFDIRNHVQTQVSEAAFAALQLTISPVLRVGHRSRAHARAKRRSAAQQAAHEPYSTSEERIVYRLNVSYHTIDASQIRARIAERVEADSGNAACLQNPAFIVLVLEDAECLLMAIRWSILCRIPERSSRSAARASQLRTANSHVHLGVVTCRWKLTHCAIGTDLTRLDRYRSPTTSALPQGKEPTHHPGRIGASLVPSGRPPDSPLSSPLVYFYNLQPILIFAVLC